MKTILLWESPQSNPRRLTVADAVASALVRSGVAAAADPADAGALAAGGPLSSDTPVMIALEHGLPGLTRLTRYVVPLAAAQIAISAGVAAGVGMPIVLPPVAAPSLLRESFDAVGSFGVNGNGAIEASTLKVQGTAALRIRSIPANPGAGIIVSKTLPVQFDPSLDEAFAYYVDPARSPGESFAQVYLGRGGAYGIIGTLSESGSSVSASSTGDPYWDVFSVSEVSTIPTGVGQVDIRLRPANNEVQAVSVDALMGKARGVPTLVVTFDDCSGTIYEKAMPMFEAKGWKMTACVGMGKYAGPYFDNGGAVQIEGRVFQITLAQAKDMYARGHSVINDSHPNGESLNREGSRTASIAALKANRDALISNGMPRGANHFCYANGYIGDMPATNSATVSSISGNVVTFTSAPPAIVGATARGRGVPLGATVTAVSGNTATLSATPTTSVGQIIAFRDESGEWAPWNLAAVLRAEGFQLARTTAGLSGGIYTKHGHPEPLRFHGTSMTNITEAAIRAAVDKAFARGTTLMMYTHHIVEDGETVGIGISRGRLQYLLDYWQSKMVASGTGTVLSVDQLWERDLRAPLPVPTA